MKRLLVALLLISSSASAQVALRGPGLRLIPQLTSPVNFSAGRVGLWTPSTGGNANKPLWRNSDGTDSLMAAGAAGYSLLQQSGSALTVRTTLNLTGAGVSCVDNAGATRTDCTFSGGGSTVGIKGAYNGGSTAADEIIGLTSTLGGVLVRDNATPIGGNLLAVQSSTGGQTFFGVTANGAQASNYDTPTSAALAIGPTNANQISMGAVTTLTPRSQAGGTPYPAFWVTGAANTNSTASTEVQGTLFDLSATRQWATGAITTQRDVLIKAPTYSFVGASTITNAATFAITGAPVSGANATITNSYALWVQAGSARFDGGIRFADGTTQTTAAGAGGGTVTSITMGTGLASTQSPLTTAGTMSVDQTFAPTWTGVHTHTASMTWGTDNTYAFGDATHRATSLYTLGVGSGASSLTLTSGVANGASAVGNILDTTNALTTGGAKTLSIRAAGVEKFYIDSNYYFLSDQGLVVMGRASAGNLQDCLLFTGGQVIFRAAGNNVAAANSSGGLSFVPSGDATTSNGIAGQRWSQSWSMSYNGAVQSPTFGATMNIDPTTNGETKRIVMTASLGAWTITNGNPGQICTIEFIQDATGSRTIGTVPSNVKLSGGTMTLTTTASKRDTLTLRWDSVDSVWVEVGRALNI